MYKFEILAQKTKEGKLSLNSKELNRLVNLLEEGTILITMEVQKPPKTIEEYRAEYFAKRDIVAEGTGNTKKAIHEWAKEEFNHGGSTKLLNEDGWKEFLKQFKGGAFEQFNIYL